MYAQVVSIEIEAIVHGEGVITDNGMPAPHYQEWEEMESVSVTNVSINGKTYTSQELTEQMGEKGKAFILEWLAESTDPYNWTAE